VAGEAAIPVASAALGIHQRSAEEKKKEMQARGEAGPGAAFMEYGQAREAMKSMLTRIKTKVDKGNELSSAERAALLDPRAVLDLLQEHGTLTSTQAQDTINYILSQAPTGQRLMRPPVRKPVGHGSSYYERKEEMRKAAQEEAAPKE